MTTSEVAAIINVGDLGIASGTQESSSRPVEMITLTKEIRDLLGSMATESKRGSIFGSGTSAGIGKLASELGAGIAAAIVGTVVAGLYAPTVAEKIADWLINITKKKPADDGLTGQTSGMATFAGPEDKAIARLRSQQHILSQIKDIKADNVVTEEENKRLEEYSIQLNKQYLDQMNEINKAHEQGISETQNQHNALMGSESVMNELNKAQQLYNTQIKDTVTGEKAVTSEIMKQIQLKLQLSSISAKAAKGTSNMGDTGSGFGRVVTTGGSAYKVSSGGKLSWV